MLTASFYATIGAPRLHLKDAESGLAIDMAMPREIMFDMIRENANWLLCNGTDAERVKIKELARDVLRLTV